MKTITKIGLYGLVGGVTAFMAGCATKEPIIVDYVMPARAVADVSKVNVAAIQVTANVKGGLAGDNKRNAGLVKQLLAMRLYKEGYYQVADDFWSSPDGAAELTKMVKDKDAGHGYPMLAAMGQGTEKVVIDLTLDLELDSRPVKKDMEYTLKTIPWTVVPPKKKGMPPTSVPGVPAIQKVKQPVTVYELVAKGTLKAKFKGVKGQDAPVKYENTFTISVPKKDRFDAAAPSQLKALAAVVTPAVNGVVSDISPYKKSRKLVAVEGGDERVVYLLNAKAFPEVVTVVEELEQAKKANYADYENLGIAFVALGEFFSARDAYAKAEKANPQSPTAKAGSKRVADVLSGNQAVKASGAKQNKDTKFSK